MTRRVVVSRSSLFSLHSISGSISGIERSKAVLKKFPNHADRLARLTIEGGAARFFRVRDLPAIKRRQDHD